MDDNRITDFSGRRKDDLRARVFRDGLMRSSPSDTSMISYTVFDKAYIKIVLHAAKYPHKRVNGVLIGKDADSGAIQFVDSVPLLHHWTGLSPSTEIGIDLARNYAQSQGLDVVGYYQASDHADDSSLSPTGERVAEIIRSWFPSAVAFVVQGSNIGLGQAALIPYLPQGPGSSSGLWRPAVRKEDVLPFGSSSHFKLESTDVPSRALELVRKSRLQEKIGDFDDHLEDVSIDWLRNSVLNI